jgi:endonuclease III
MATTTNKQRALQHLLGHAGKHHDPEPNPRPILEEFIYALCRENATPEQADRAYSYLVERFYDWNEVRVSSARELEDAFAGLSAPEARAQRLLSFLQEVFETTFSFDLEGLQKKKGLKEAAKALARYQAADDFVSAWVVQRSLGGHAIPIDAPTLRCAQRLGLVDAGQDDPEAARATLEHLVPKAKGPAFTDAISQVAEDYCWEDDPQCHSCPLSADCPTAQEAGVEPVHGGRAARAKPR